ncbi:MAG: alpha/beta fold hydrolase [Actinobacteria bacterium]|nr:alpha/beta fold hydrolase [Actinomycetota bacterium]
MPTVQANGISIYYELSGAGEPLVLIGGLGADSSLTAGLAPAFTHRYQVLVFDNRGAGRSSKPDLPAAAGPGRIGLARPRPLVRTC